MTEEEIYEELEITYGKPPRTTSEKNMIWLKGVLEEHIIEGEFNEDVPKPSLDALAMTLIAITTYDIPMEELAAKKPAIKRTLLWFIVKRSTANLAENEIDDAKLPVSQHLRNFLYLNVLHVDCVRNIRNDTQ